MEVIICALVVIGALSIFSLVFAIVAIVGKADNGPEVDKARQQKLATLLEYTSLENLSSLNGFARNLDIETIRNFDELSDQLKAEDGFLLKHFQQLINERKVAVKKVENKLLDKAKK